MREVDVAIVGGGAAGIAAARRLAGHGRSVLVIEALPRLGGRAHSARIGEHILDLGCGWMHSAERNPLAALADAAGLIIERGEPAWQKQLRNIGASADRLRAAWIAYDAFVQRLHRDPPPGDCAGDAIGRDDPWRPFIDGLSSFINGAELDRLSIADFLAYDDAASETNWRLPGGYGAFITSLGARLPTALDTTVVSIDGSGGHVTVETDRGAIRARAAIVTVSSAVLASGAIRFAPAVDDHLHAAACLPLGLANKIHLSIADPDAVPPESHLLGNFDRAATGSYYLRPFGRPIIEGFLGGAHAAALEDEDDAAVADFAIGELRALLGGEFARGLTLMAITRWGRQPTIAGSYSHALPGHAGARAKLARPASEWLVFAGEACAEKDFSTAHGAWQSGLAAADWIERQRFG